MKQLVFEALGTHWIIDIDVSVKRLKSIEDVVIEWLSRFEKTYSRFDSDSWLVTIGKKTGSYPLPDDGYELLSWYEKMYRMTNGVFTPLVGQNLVEAGYDRQYSLKPKRLQRVANWDEVIIFDHEQVKILKPCQLDFGGVGKGWAIDKIGQLLQKREVGEYTIDAGGDIFNYSQKGGIITVGLEHPDNRNEVIGEAYIGNASICGSAGNRRNWGSFHHIINPLLLSSPKAVVASWVVAQSALVADTLATCLLLVPLEMVANVAEFAYVMVDQQRGAVFSKNFPGKLY